MTASLLKVMLTRGNISCLSTLHKRVLSRRVQPVFKSDPYEADPPPLLLAHGEKVNASMLRLEAHVKDPRLLPGCVSLGSCSMEYWEEDHASAAFSWVCVVDMEVNKCLSQVSEDYLDLDYGVSFQCVVGAPTLRSRDSPFILSLTSLQTGFNTYTRNVGITLVQTRLRVDHSDLDTFIAVYTHIHADLKESGFFGPNLDVLTQVIPLNDTHLVLSDEVHDLSIELKVEEGLQVMVVASREEEASLCIHTHAMQCRLAFQGSSMGFRNVEYSVNMQQARVYLEKELREGNGRGRQGSEGSFGSDKSEGNMIIGYEHSMRRNKPRIHGDNKSSHDNNRSSHENNKRSHENKLKPTHFEEEIMSMDQCTIGENLKEKDRGVTMKKCHVACAPAQLARLFHLVHSYRDILDEWKGQSRLAKGKEGKVCKSDSWLTSPCILCVLICIHYVLSRWMSYSI